MKAWQRVATAALTGFCVFAGMLAGSPSVPAAVAEGAITLDQAKQKLAKLKSETEALEQRIQRSEDIMYEALVQQASLQAEIESQEELLGELAPEFALIFNAQRQAQKWQYTVGFMLIDDSSQFMDHLGVSDTVWIIWNEKMERLADEKQQLDNLNTALEETIEGIRAEVEEQKAMLKRQQAAQKEAETLVLTLTYAQRQAWASASRTVKPHTLHLIQVVTDLFPKIKIVYTLRAGSHGDHGYGRAADFMIPNYRHNVAMGWAIANYVQAHARELHVQYIIYQQSIWNISRASEGWRHMAGRGNDTANHRDHVHVSMKS